MTPPLAHITCWLIDLDNTIYDADAHAFPEMHQKMRQYIMNHTGLDAASADHLRDHLLDIYGATMRGLVEEHGVNPEDFMHYTHTLERSHIPKCDILSAYLPKLPGKRIIFTNSMRKHVDGVLSVMGIRDHFDAIFDAADTDYKCKPMQAPYDTVIKKHGLDPAATCFIDDSLKNLKPAYDMGMTTVWIDRGRTDTPENGFFHHRAPSLAKWLQDVL